MKRFLSILLIITVLTSGSGCWDMTELSEIGLVLLIGIDSDSQGDGFEITVHVHTPTSSGDQEQSGGGGASQNVWVASTRGQTIMDAFRNLRSQAGVQLSFHHARLILIGEDLARKGINPVLDHMLRTREIRINSLLLVCQGTAKDYLQTRAVAAENLMDKLEGALANEEVWSKSHSTEIFRFVQDLLDPGTQPVASRLIKIKPEPGLPAPNPGQEQEEVEEMILVEGASVFNDDQLVGWLTGTETIGYKFLTGNHGTMLLVVPWRGGMAAFEVTMNSCAKNVSFPDGKPTFAITIFVSINMVEYTGYADLTQTGVMEELRNLATDQVSKILQSTVEKAKSMEVDFLGFGGIVSRRHPKQWETLNKKWRETFPQVGTSFDIRSDMLMPGTWVEPIPR